MPTLGVVLRGRRNRYWRSSVEVERPDRDSTQYGACDAQLAVGCTDASHRGGSCYCLRQPGAAAGCAARRHSDRCSQITAAVQAVHALRDRRGAPREPLFRSGAPAQRRDWQPAARLGQPLPGRHHDAGVARRGGVPRRRGPPGAIPATPRRHRIQACLLLSLRKTASPRATEAPSARSRCRS
jgi:hypothetical protein